MNLPPDITEEQFLTAWDRIASFVAPGFCFGYYDVEDIKQEAFIIAMEAVSSYDPSKSQLDTFLKTVIVKRLATLRRDKFVRSDIPCSQCKTPCSQSLGTDCDRYTQWVERNRVKKDLMENNQTDDIMNANLYKEVDLVRIMDSELLRAYIDLHLPYHMRKTYLLWLDDMSIKKGDKESMIECVRELMEDYTGEEREEMGEKEEVGENFLNE